MDQPVDRIFSSNKEKILPLKHSKLNVIMSIVTMRFCCAVFASWQPRNYNSKDSPSPFLWYVCIHKIM